MVKGSEALPRWVMRRDGRSAGRYDGNKVVRWIARPTLTKTRLSGGVASIGAEGATARGDWPRLGGFGLLRIVADT